MADKTVAWDKLLIGLLAAVNPVVVIVVGHFLQNAIAENTTQINNLKTAAETQSIQLQQNVDKAKVIKDWVGDLAGDNALRRDLAIQALVLTLPDVGPSIQAIVIRSSQGKPDQKGAERAVQDALGATRDRLVADLFSDVRPTRLTALLSLQKGWLTDTEMADLVLARGNQEIRVRQAKYKDSPADDERNPSDESAGLYNAVSYFGAFRDLSDPALKKKIREFLVVVQTVGSRDTRALAAATMAKFN
jgi:hypothetical protein